MLVQGFAILKRHNAAVVIRYTWSAKKKERKRRRKKCV